MSYHAITPFRRPLVAARMAHKRQPAQPMPAESVSKWDALRDLSAGRKAFGLTDRDLTVLNALVSFYPDIAMDDPARLVVHASNAAICERLHGMPCSTMRRHLARLVEAGVVDRQDSPNGKRYVRRSSRGEQRFGLDLSPLPRRIAEIREAAQAARAAADEIKQLKCDVSLMRRDLLCLLDLAACEGTGLPRVADYDELLRLSACEVRRKSNVDRLRTIKAAFVTAIGELRTDTCAHVAENLSNTDAQNEQHCQSSEKELSEIERGNDIKEGRSSLDVVPLDRVVSVCPEILMYCGHQIGSWRDLIRAADTVRPMMGITSSLWHEAKQTMGEEAASTTLAAMLQRFQHIRSPGAYLRKLCAKAASKKFTPVPMLMALSRNRLLGSSQL